MADPLSTLVVSSFNALKLLVELGLRWRDVTPDTRNFLLNIRQVDEKINTARRLRRQKSDYLDASTKKEVDNDIKNAHHIMQEIGKTIEPNRVDIDLHDTVGTWNRFKWLLQGHAGFMTHQNTLNIALQALICSINRMTVAQRPSFSPVTSEDSLEFQAPLLPPSARRRVPRWSSGGESDRSSIEDTLYHVKSQPITSQEQEVVLARLPFNSGFVPSSSDLASSVLQPQIHSPAPYCVIDFPKDVIGRYLAELDVDFKSSTTTLCAELDEEASPQASFSQHPLADIVQQEGGGTEAIHVLRRRRRRNGGIR